MLKHRAIKGHNTCPPMAVLRETQACANILFSCQELMSLLTGLTELTMVKRCYLRLILKGWAAERKDTVKKSHFQSKKRNFIHTDPHPALPASVEEENKNIFRRNLTSGRGELMGIACHSPHQNRIMLGRNCWVEKAYYCQSFWRKWSWSFSSPCCGDV